jgi:hypothetical protein
MKYLSPFFFAHYLNIEIHAVILFMFAAARKGQCVISAGDSLGNSLAHPVLISAEELVDPSARILDLRLAFQIGEHGFLCLSARVIMGNGKYFILHGEVVITECILGLL